MAALAWMSGRRRRAWKCAALPARLGLVVGIVRGFVETLRGHSIALRLGCGAVSASSFAGPRFLIR